MTKYILLTTILLITACTTTRQDWSSADDWMIGGDADWTFTKEKITGTITEGVSFLMTKEEYSDFELTLEFNPDSEVNSGIFTRCQKKDISPLDCYEINIWDNHPDQQNRTGAIVTKVPPLELVYTTNKWNTCKIIAKGTRTQVWMNGIQTADYTDDQYLKGYIGLQVAVKGSVQFRNIRIERKE